MADIFTLELDGLPPDAKVVALHGAEAISQPYRFDVSIILPVDDGDFDPDAALESIATLRVMDGQGAARARFVGEVHGAEFVHATARHLLFRVEIRPRLWRLANTFHSRVWVDKTFPEVVQTVLRESGVTDVELNLTKRYATLPHVCQYQESDLAFVSRWMEREGVYFYFEHVEGGEVLHLTDDHNSLTDAVESPLRFFAADGDGDTSATESVRDFRRLHGMQSLAAKLFDYDYLKPTADLSGESQVAGGGFGRAAAFGDNLRTTADARRLAQVRAEERGASRTVFRGDGRVFGLAPGYRFDLDEHPVASLNGAYLVTELEHRGSNLSDAGELRDWLGDVPAGDAPEYRASFVAIGADVPYRPPQRAPWPRVRGLEPARVDGPSHSEYAQIDEHGRYKVRVLFDESQRRPGQNSAWVRMAQPHGGEPEGWHFPLRDGTEVMLGFVEGDPDRPVIVGVGPNPDTPSPVTEPNHSQNVIMTGGRNRIEIEDQDGSQYVEISSPPQATSLHLGAHNGPLHQGHNVTLTTDGNGLIHMGGVRDITVGGAQNETVDGDLVEHYYANQTTTVDGDFTETVHGSATQTIHGGETRTVHAGHSETITGGETRDVTGGQAETYAAAVTRDVTADVSDTVHGDVTRTVMAGQTETISGALSSDVTGAVTMVTPGAYTVNAAAGVTYNAPGGFTMLAPGGFTQVDEDHTSEGGESDENFANELALIMAFMLDVCPAAAEVTHVKMEANLVKAENISIHAKAKDTEIKTWGMLLCGGALAFFAPSVLHVI